ncbi:MAG: Mpo1-like protein [Thermodesulfobacteriota bacterium]
MTRLNNHEQEFRNFNKFYEYYLSEHTDPLNRRLHFLGCIIVLILALSALLTGKLILLLLAPVFGYGLAWAGHFLVEKNKPASFRHPIWSLMGDWMMFKDILTGKMKL